MTVYILTYSPTPAQIYGNLLALKTARVGFPSAEIIITDNCSCSEAREIFKELCIEHGYEYRQLTEEIQHHEHLQTTIENASGPIAFVDGDVVFWKNCEHFLDDVSIYEIRIKGMFYPSHSMYCSHGLTWCMPRLHTSFLCLSDAQEVDYLLKPLKLKYSNPWQSVGSTQMLLAKTFWDTGCIPYEELTRWHQPFTDEELDCFDHLRVGTHLERAGYNAAKAGVGMTDPILSKVHQIAQTGDYSKLKGIWREQQQHLQQSHDAGPFWQQPDFWKR